MTKYKPFSKLVVQRKFPLIHEKKPSSSLVVSSQKTNQITNQISKKKQKSSLQRKLQIAQTTQPRIYSVLANAQIVFNLLLIFVTLFLLFYFLFLVYTDAKRVREEETNKIMIQIQECEEKYLRNQCDNENKPPILSEYCRELSLCLSKNTSNSIR
ncbi:nucleus export protein brr6 [Anaeramoeba flamelloides]|uniref:Nucleus export protein brr6 n=1 Tax=Anaeramoeba flamelloides TaxID=1746091 RepID=A0AAV7Y7Z0_9EUKA|nr:nucleus export protein brr6 [Anaeramoeba flamelloides]